MGGARIGGRYELGERIGEGGMAEVFLAVARGAGGFERKVVVKRMLPRLAARPGVAERFLEEARLLAQLAHPHIAQVLDVGDEEGGPYLVIEHVAGHDLRELLVRAEGPLPPGLAALVARDVADALEYAFALRDPSGVPLKLIHRDISLGNVMVSDHGVVKLIDFGIARALSEPGGGEWTGPGQVCGTYSYLAPEVLDGGMADHRSDLFALGAVLFELCSGRKLYRTGLDHLEMLAERRAPLEPPSRFAPSVPPALDAIVLAALARDPAQRPQSAGELSHSLDELVHAERGSRGELERFVAQQFAPERFRPTQERTLPEAPAPGDPPPREESRTDPGRAGTDGARPPLPGPADPAARRAEATPTPRRAEVTTTPLRAEATTTPRRAEATRTPRRAGRPLSIALGSALFAAAAGTFYYAARRPTAAPASPQQTAAIAAPAAAAPPIAPPIHVQIDSRPAGAEVFAEGGERSLGRTPCTIELPARRGRASLTLRHAGFPDLELDVPADRDSQLAPDLARAP